MTPEQIAKLLVSSETLTEIPRTGYVLEGVSDPEKVSSHCFGVVMLTTLLSENIDDINQLKAMKMAVIHDLPEAVIGDLTPSASKFIDKLSIEKKVALSMFSDNQELSSLFLEYLEGNSLEAKLVHDADKLQMFARVSIYKRQGKGDMSRFKEIKFHFKVTKEILTCFKHLDGETNIK